MAVKHKLPKETVAQIPEAMADPIMIFRSATVGGDYVVILGLKDQDGATVIVPISLNQTSRGGYDVNEATSVYGKGNVETGKPNNRWFINQIQADNLIYQNKNKSRNWFRATGLQLPRDPNQRGNKTIYTDDDLVNLRSKKGLNRLWRRMAGVVNIRTKSGRQPEKT